MKNAAFALVEQKVIELKDAINKLGNGVETNAFGLDEWCESLDEALFDLDEDLEGSDS